MNKTTPAAKGLRTGYQAIVGSVIGLVAAIWAVPGVPDAFQGYLKTNALPLLLSIVGLIGIPSGIVAFLQNKVEDK